MAGPGGRLFEMLLEHNIPERSARIYLVACQTGPQTAAELARAAGTNRAESYRLIRQLEVSGLLRSAGHRPARFAALPPAALIDRWMRGATERLRRLESDKLHALEELRDGLVDLSATDLRKFTVLEGGTTVFRYIARRIGTSRREVVGAVPGAVLSRILEGGVAPALKAAHGRGVRVRIVTEVSPTNLTAAKHLRTFAELRHSSRPLRSRAWEIDGKEAVIYLAGTEGIEGHAADTVAIASPAPSFRKPLSGYLKRTFAHARPFESRVVDLENPDPAAVLVQREDGGEAFERFREIASLGMRAIGRESAQFHLPDVVETVGRQLGREIAGEVEGETVDEIARSLSAYYKDHAPGRLDVTRTHPFTLKVTNCFACVNHSTEVGRMLCPAMLKSIFETRAGGAFDVSTPDPRKHATRGCVFSLTPS